jgi:hypothetical protein
LVEYEPSVYVVVVALPDGLEIVTVIVSGDLLPDELPQPLDEAMVSSIKRMAHIMFLLIFNVSSE